MEKFSQRVLIVGFTILALAQAQFPQQQPPQQQFPQQQPPQQQFPQQQPPQQQFPQQQFPQQQPTQQQFPQQQVPQQQFPQQQPPQQQFPQQQQPSQQLQPTSICQSSFVTALYQCASNRSLDRDQFVWLARSGQLGVQPTDVQAFTDRVCLEKQSLFLCINTLLEKVKNLAENVCPQSEKVSIQTLVRGILKTVNSKCESPCRAQLRLNLEKCLSDQNFRASDYLTLNMTSPHEQLIGPDRLEVDRFCKVRFDISRCLKLASALCVDSKSLLRSYGLDLDSLDATYTLLCNSSSVYLDSLECYRSPSPALFQCLNTLTSSLAFVEQQFSELNITDLQYRDQLCQLRASYIDCDLRSQSQQTNNKTNKCTAAVVGLRRQRECTLVPLECYINNPNAINTLCQPSGFNLAERQFSSSGGLHSSFILISFLFFLNIFRYF